MKEVYNTKRYFVAGGTTITRSTATHNYKFAVIGRGPSKHCATGGFRADRAGADNEAARLNRIQASYAARSAKPQAWTWEVVPALEITAAAYRALGKSMKEVDNA